MANFDGKKLNDAGLSEVWTKVAQLIKKITGDVDIKTKGNLQYQIDQQKAANEHLAQELDELKLSLAEGEVYIPLTDESCNYISTESGDELIAAFRV